MEPSRRLMPLYGQVEAHVTLPDGAGAPVNAEYYVVLQGSRLTHVTVAKRRDDGVTLCFTVPGHDRAEVVCVTSFFHAGEQVKPCGGESSLAYIRDVAQDVAEYLDANRDQLGPRSHLEVLKRFSARTGASDDREDVEEEAGLRQLDEKITQAFANLDLPQRWRHADSQPTEVTEVQPKETLLHLAARLGLVHLSHFLRRQPRGQRALTVPNQEGDTPLQLAQKCGEHAVCGALATPPVPALRPVAGVRCVWSDSSGVLKFCPVSDSLTLSVQQAAGSCPLDGVAILRDRMRDRGVLRLIDALRANFKGDSSNTGDGLTSDGAVRKELRVEEHVLVNTVFEEQLVLSLDDEDDEEGEYLLSSAVNGHGIQSSQSQCAAVPQLSMISSSDEPQMDGNSKCNVDGVTSDSTGTDGGLWDTVDSDDLLLATDTPPPSSDDRHPPPFPLSPADQALARLSRAAVSEATDHSDRDGGSPTMETCDLSPSLVALEVDSEEESTEPQTPLPPLSSDTGRSENKRETFAPSPDLTCTRTKSASSACDPTPKAMSDQGIRLRSYSYSSPKISLRPSRFARDNPSADISPDGVLHSVSYSRSLLQALSLSKSLSLLHPGKQRALSLSEQSHEKREIRFRMRAQSTDDERNMELAESLQHLTLSEFLKEIEEEDSDKYSIPSKVESEKYKVIRTFSFLKSRMASTRNKSKGKGKDREAKDRQSNGHRFSSGSCLGATVCVVCDKPASGKDLLHCSSCTLYVHKGCKESVPPCLKKLQDKYGVSMVKNRTASLPQNFTVRDSPPQCSVLVSPSLPVMTPKEKKEAAPLSCPLPGSLPSFSDSRLNESSETESDGWKATGQSEEPQPTPASSASTDSSFGEDCVDVYAHNGLSADALDYEAESWSLTVEHKFCKRQDKRVVKRQDVIYELMQTEVHHLQTLHIMAEVFRRGMREEVQLDAEAAERVFPCLDQLILFHHAFFSTMREQQHSSAEPQGHKNYLIRRIGDVLLQQFSNENGEKMKQIYGEFCSRHNEAVSFFKELQQHNKRFQNFVKQQSSNSLVRRKEIPECILLVTQRITKYPVLLERILQHTQEETEEHADLSKALAQIREIITAVDLKVSEYERQQRLQEVWNRMENRSTAKLKNGHTFRKQDMMGPGQTLKHQGLLLWKTATGRLKDVLALLLTDSLIFLQEKDQKFTFAAVDQKPPVIALQKLIVREVANEERGMFLISASAAGPEMYEVHTSSKDERNTWMRLIREAVESCPEEEEEYTSESEEEKRAAEARVQKIHKFQESLVSHDQQICLSLEEKLQLYAEMSAASGRATEASHLLEPRLLVQPLSEEPPQAAALLAAALREAENLKATLSSRSCSSSVHTPDSEMDAVFPVSPVALSETPSDPEASPASSDATEGSWTEALLLQSLPDLEKSDTTDIKLKVAQSVQSLTQLLYSLQAAVTIQDSCYEVHRVLLQTERPSPRAQRPHPPSFRGNTLQEQEKQRNLEKQKEEVAAAQRLQDRLRQEKERWERECQARGNQQGEQESRLEDRERQCRLEAERLRRERDELEEQLEEYQQSLERLREGRRSVEREREKLESEQMMLQGWNHGRQRSLPTVIPHMLIPLDGQQDSAPCQSRDHAGNGSVFVNEAALAGTGINNRHVHHRGNDPSAHNCLNTLLARSNSRQPPVAKTPHPHSESQGWVMETGYLYTPAGGLGLEHTPRDLNSNSYIREAWASTATGADPYPARPHPVDPQLDLSVLVSLETDSGGEESREENIVYL